MENSILNLKKSLIFSINENFPFKSNKLLGLNKELIRYISEYLNLNEYMMIYTCKNKKLFKILLENKKYNKTIFSKDLDTIIKKSELTNGFAQFGLVNVFCVFNDDKENSILVYPSINKGLINLVFIHNNTLKSSLKGHQEKVLCLRYYENCNIKYLISSSNDRSIRLWSLNDYKCLICINNCHLSSNLFSCLMFEIDQIGYIISSVSSYEKMKVFNLNGENCKSFGDKNVITNFIDVWFNYSLNTHFIINCNNRGVVLYNFKTGDVYRKFKAIDFVLHFSAVVLEKPDSDPLLIESDYTGRLRIWDILSGNLLNEMFIDVNLRAVLLWNHRYILVSAYEKCLIVDINDFAIKTLCEKVGLGTIIKHYCLNLGEILIIAGGVENQKSIYLYC